MRVVICVAGVIGASIAYFLSRRGAEVAVIERRGVACAVAGRSPSAAAAAGRRRRRGGGKAGEEAGP